MLTPLVCKQWPDGSRAHGRLPTAMPMAMVPDYPGEGGGVKVQRYKVIMQPQLNWGLGLAQATRHNTAMRHSQRTSLIFHFILSMASYGHLHFIVKSWDAENRS